MHAVAHEALEASEAAIIPKKTMGDVFAAHAQVFDKAGLDHASLNACDYAMGAIYNPIGSIFRCFMKTTHG